MLTLVIMIVSLTHSKIYIYIYITIWYIMVWYVTVWHIHTSLEVSRLF